MTSILNKIRIPTLLGLAVIVFGMAAGIYLTLQKQNQTLKSIASTNARDIKLVNIEDNQAGISWITDTPLSGFVKYRTEGANEQTSIDDRDRGTQTPSARVFHFVTLTNLTPATTYQYQIISGSLTTPPNEFTTAPQMNTQNDFKAIVGSVLDGDHFLPSGLVFLEIPGAMQQGTFIKSLGNFILPLSKLRTADLNDVFKDASAEARLNVLTEDGKEAHAILILGKIRSPIGPPLKLGQETDLTAPIASPSALEKYDLNNDGIINSADVSVILNNFCKKPECKNLKVPRADLNGDGDVNQKDLDLISEQIAKLGNQ